MMSMKTRGAVLKTVARSSLWVLAVSVGWCASVASGQVRYQLESGQWRKEAVVDPATPAGKLHAVREALAGDRAQAAVELADRFINDHPNHTLLPEAYLLRGDATVAAGDPFKALYDYEYVIRQYPGSEQFGLALEREYKIARLFASGVKRKFLGMRILSAAGEAEEIFIRIQERSPGSELGELASLALGDFYFDRGEMSSAAEAYDLFLINYPRSQHTEKVMLRQIHAGLATFKGPRFDQTGLLDAAHRAKTFQRQFPAAAERLGADALLVRVDESLALKMLYAGQWYEKRGEQVSAVYQYQRVVRDYPRTAAAGRAIQRLRELGKPAVLPADGVSQAGPVGAGQGVSGAAP